MDFIRRTIIEHETVINKELLDSFQDGIVEGITKAEEALATPPVVCNAPTSKEFPYVGNSGVIYKAESEKMLYQWNSEKMAYEPLYLSSGEGVDEIECIDGGTSMG